MQAHCATCGQVYTTADSSRNKTVRCKLAHCRACFVIRDIDSVRRRRYVSDFEDTNEQLQ